MRYLDKSSIWKRRATSGETHSICRWHPFYRFNQRDTASSSRRSRHILPTLFWYDGELALNPNWTIYFSSSGGAILELWKRKSPRRETEFSFLPISIYQRLPTAKSYIVSWSWLYHPCLDEGLPFHLPPSYLSLSHSLTHTYTAALEKTEIPPDMNSPHPSSFPRGKSQVTPIYDPPSSGLEAIRYFIDHYVQCLAKRGIFTLSGKIVICEKYIFFSS